MPHINRIRVNNVKYNFGTQFYDDFIMRFDGKNTLYDLANGGGKSVLMLLLFQNLIPNCTLDDKQPIEKLFRTAEGSTSIHSLIEWKLDPEDVEDGYKYMLTGFCARKAKGDSEEEALHDTASIDYYNYVIFYREYNENDLVNLPLSKGKERMTYTGLRTYLKELEHKDYALKIQIFDRKGAYQQFIAGFGLYESQWEIIRGINKTEGHVRTYFETNYKTTRKVVEDLLIEEIIQKAYLSKTGGEAEDMAGTLMAIRDKLLELSRKRQEMSAYDHQAEALESFSGRVASLHRLYQNEDQYKADLSRTYNGLLNHIKLKTRDGEVLEKELGFSRKHLTEIERKLDTVKVQKRQEELLSLVNDNQKIQATLGEKEAAYGRKAMTLAETESMKDYLEYVENRESAFALKVVINQSENDPEGHAAELKSLALAGKKAYDQEMSKLIEAEVRTRTALDETEHVIKQTGQALTLAEKTEAVTTHELEQEKHNEKQILDEISMLRRQVNALLVEGSEKEIRNCKQKEQELKKQIVELEDQNFALNLEIQNLTVTGKQTQMQILADGAEKERIAQFFKEYDDCQKKTDDLLKVYGATSYERLDKSIYERYKKAIMDMGQLDGEIRRLKKLAENLNDKIPLLEPEEAEAVISYLRRCHNATCILGMDYLKELTNEERQQIITRMPYLPSAIIVYSDFEPILQDMTFKATKFGDRQVMVLSYDYIAGDAECFDASQMIFAGCNTELFWDPQAIEKEQLQIKNQLDQLSNQKDRLIDYESTYRTDLENVYHFMDAYFSKHVQMINRQSEIEKELIALNNKLGQDEKRLKEAQSECAANQKQMDVLGVELQDVTLQRQALETINAKNMVLDEVRERQRSLIQRKNSTKAELSGLNTKLSQATEAKDRLQKEQQMLGQQINEMKESWRAEFELYYDEHLSLPGDKALPTYGEILLHFQTIRQAYEAQNMDLEDKKLLLDHYEKNMARLEYSIAARNHKLEELEEKRKSSMTLICDLETIEKLRAELEDISQEIHMYRAMLNDASANQHRLTGSVENAVSVIEEKYGYYQEVDLKNMDYEIFMNEYRQSYEQMKAKQQKMLADLEKNVKALRIAEDLKKDLERLMKHMSVKIGMTKDSERPDMNFKELINQLSEQYERLRKDEDLKKSEFEKDRDKLVETLKLLEAYDLADEIRNQVSLPESEAQADQLLLSLADTVKIIQLEKSRIEKGIENMQSIKESFEQQCIQRCVDIRMELEKLPKMSKITLKDEAIQMIGLRIPYVKEEFYAQKMSDYIDQIVGDSDTIPNEKDRLKYLQNALSWKRLFSVIVTDMNQIRLNLYKREPIREQSRFLRYEEAVGSTGQSQGIYIQFLIAVINYISSIHSGSNETSGLGKVIFIDNPFGAAKDIYIWEPIFELLKENKVQLIVPARGATPAITGKFDVNYVLGQKLIGQRQQTVVVDYHSSVNIDEVEYKAIEFEQQTFDFV